MPVILGANQTDDGEATRANRPAGAIGSRAADEQLTKQQQPAGPAHRPAERLGLGRALRWQGIHALRGRGAGRILLGVDAGNDRARRLYHQTGFRTSETFGYHRLALAARPGG